MSKIWLFFLQIFRNLNDKFPLKIAKTSRQKQNFPGMKWDFVHYLQSHHNHVWRVLREEFKDHMSATILEWRWNVKLTATWMLCEMSYHQASWLAMCDYASFDFTVVFRGLPFCYKRHQFQIGWPGLFCPLNYALQ